MLIGVILVGAVAGMRYGLIRAAFNTAGMYVGWLLAGRFSDDVGSIFSNSLSNETVVTVLAYGVIVVVMVVAANVAMKVVRPLLTVFTLGLSGLVDRLGGLTLGFFVGLAIVGVIIIALARLTYDFSPGILTKAIPGEVAVHVPTLVPHIDRVKAVRGVLEEALTEARVVNIFIDVTTAIPGNTLGFVPADFKVALHILEADME